MMQGQKQPNLLLMGSTYNSLGRLQRELAVESKDPADVEALQQRAFENLSAARKVYDRIPSDSRPIAQLKMVELNLCVLERHRKHLADATQHCTDAWVLHEEQGALDTYGFDILQYRGLIEADQGHYDEAVAIMRKGIEQGSPRHTAALRIELATLMWRHEPSRRSEAIALVREALEGLPKSETRQEAEAWLREHAP